MASQTLTVNSVTPLVTQKVLHRLQVTSGTTKFLLQARHRLCPTQLSIGTLHGYMAKQSMLYITCCSNGISRNHCKKPLIRLLLMTYNHILANIRSIHACSCAVYVQLSLAINTVQNLNNWLSWLSNDDPCWSSTDNVSIKELRVLWYAIVNNSHIEEYPCSPGLKGDIKRGPWNIVN